MRPDLTLVPSAAAPAPAPVPASLQQQAEMPFAVVEGQPITELPRDLYIPPQALEVFLEAFEGPLDLLLYLIRRQNLDILDIPIAEITRQYTRYIELMQVLQLELAGEYLLMAATLAEVKSRMLLPRVHAEDTEEADPRAELVRRLQEYERFKRAAEGIDRIARVERDTWVASADLVDRKVVRIPPQVTLPEMLLAFQEVLARSDMFAHHHVQREALSVRQRMTDVLSSLNGSAFLDFVRLFRPEEGRRGVTVTFVAILELLKEGLIDIVQSEAYGPLHVRLGNPAKRLRLVTDDALDAAANDAVAHNAGAGEDPTRDP
jgi:segregation and condensation protein A